MPGPTVAPKVPYEETPPPPKKGVEKPPAPKSGIKPAPKKA
jgi:hypothetical protein